MATTSADCKLKGCKLIWACINNAGEPLPIGCVTAATLNSAEEDGDSAGKFGGTLATDQTTPLQTVIDADGDTILADNETRFLLGTQFYDSCSASSSGCVDTLNLTVDYCFQKDCTGSDAGAAANQRKLICGAQQELKLFKLNPNGSLEELWCGLDSKITSKNRTFASGQSTEHTFDLTIEAREIVYSSCFH